jgi:heme exporter protein A
MEPKEAAGASREGLAAVELGFRRDERWIFRGLSFTVAPGEALLVRGRNGAGKSTLLRLLAGLARPAGGRILWDGAEIGADLAAHGTRLAYLGHLDGVKGALSVEDNLLLPGLAQSAAARREALRTFGLLPFAAFPARFLSAGQKRRLALARLLLKGAVLWLLDEPGTGLDAASLARLGEVCAAHRARGGLIVATTHQPLPLGPVRELALA